MSLLSGGIANIMHRAFAGIYLPATLYVRSLAYDDGGSPAATDSEYPCRAQVDAATEAMRQAPGYTEKTVRVLVLQKGLDAKPNSNDAIAVGGASYAISAVEADPANSYWQCTAERA